MSLAPPDRRRRVLIAVLLAGFAPPGGHVYLGRSLRGFTLLLMSIAAGVGWVLIVPRSLHRAQVMAFAGLLLLLAVIVDAGIQARRSAPELPRRPLHRWWVYVVLALMTQVAVPDLMFRLLVARAGLALEPGRAMEPVVLQGERIVFERLPPLRAAERDALVVLEEADGTVFIRRVVGLPGEEIRVTDGRVSIDGLEWLHDAFRSRRRPDLDLDAVVVGREQVLVLAERRRSGDPAQGLVPLSRIRGRARWVLQPPGFPRDPQFGGRLGEALR